MKRLLIACCATAGVLGMTASATALRCGSDLVQEGETKFELLQKCGPPVALEELGYTLNRLGDRELKVEQLIYGPWSGWYYVIEVVGGRIVKIDSFTDTNR